MGYTNETPHYGLPLPLGSDKTTPMDYNTSLEAVDTALFGAVSDCASFDTRLDTAEGNISTAQGDITGLDTRLGTAEGKISTLEGASTQQALDIADVRADGQDMICAYKEPDAQSDHDYAVGDFFIYNDVLYKATEVITIGDTIVPDTNCTTDNVTTEIKALKSALSNVETDLTPLTYSTIGSEVTIESGYTALADGYFTIANAGATGDFTLTLNSTDIFKYYFDSTKPYEKFAFFVKKGMSISWTTGMTGGAYYIRYNPFVAS